MENDVRSAGAIRGGMIAGLLILSSFGGVAAQDYSPAGSGTRELELASGTTVRLLLEASNLGGTELEVAEIVFPAGMPPGGTHQHGATEIFYVVEGVLGHVVNGELHRIEPGMVGVVRPGDTVAHQVLSDGPVRAVVVWTPGGEANRIAPEERWERLLD